MSNLTAAIAQQDATAIEAAAPRTPVALLQSDTALQMIAESLPAHMDAKTFQRHAITLVKQTPTLLECEAASVAQGIVRGAALGLDPDPALGQMWLVPRNVKDGNTWTKVATFQVGWRGLYELAMRTGRVASLEVKPVHQHDRFEARIGSTGGLVHEPDWFGNRGPVVGWYAYARLASGVEMFEVLSVADAERHRDAFASSKKRDGTLYGPWVDHFDAMAQKTVFLKLAKWLPKQVERDALAEALEADGQAVRTPLQGIPGRGDIIEATHEPEPAPNWRLVRWSRKRWRRCLRCAAGGRERRPDHRHHGEGHGEGHGGAQQAHVGHGQRGVARRDEGPAGRVPACPDRRGARRG